MHVNKFYNFRNQASVKSGEKLLLYYVSDQDPDLWQALSNQLKMARTVAKVTVIVDNFSATFNVNKCGRFMNEITLESAAVFVVSIKYETGLIFFTTYFS